MYSIQYYTVYISLLNSSMLASSLWPVYPSGTSSQQADAQWDLPVETDIGRTWMPRRDQHPATLSSVGPFPQRRCLRCVSATATSPRLPLPLERMGPGSPRKPYPLRYAGSQAAAGGAPKLLGEDLPIQSSFETNQVLLVAWAHGEIKALSSRASL